MGNEVRVTVIATDFKRLQPTESVPSSVDLSLVGSDPRAAQGRPRGGGLSTADSQEQLSPRIYRILRSLVEIRNKLNSFRDERTLRVLFYCNFSAISNAA